MKTAGFKFSSQSAIKKVPVEFKCYMFFNYIDILFNAKDVDEPVENIIPMMQEAINHWEGGLKATGGALNPTISLWYTIDFKWEKTLGNIEEKIK